MVFDLVSCGRFPYLGPSRRLSRQDLDVVQAAIGAADVQEFESRNVKTLSGGERQWVYMAMLYAQDTPYVLLDEPTTHLDIAGSFDILHQLLQMKEQGKCVIAVLHDLPMALKYADGFILVNRGEARAYDSAEALLCSGQLQEAFHARCTPVTVQGRTEYIFEQL